MKMSWLVLIILLLLSGWADAATYTVSGGIQAAVSRLHAGDTLVISPGTYAERLSHIPSGVTIKAAQPGAVILRPSGVGHIITIHRGASRITLEGLVIDGSAATPGSYGVKIEGEGPFAGADHITLRRVTIRNITGAACLGLAGSGHLISGVTINGCYEKPGERIPGNTGIYWGARDSVMECSTITNASLMGSQLYYKGGVSGVTGNLLRNNVFANNGRNSHSRQPGLYIGGHGNTIEGNVFTGNAGGGVQINGNHNRITNNIGFGNGGSDVDDRGTGNTLSNNRESEAAASGVGKCGGVGPEPGPTPGRQAAPKSRRMITKP
jgi:hypothetical protein